ncbi:B3 domain-containing protein-like protein [Salvia divinorum]|uniref:B3 domain-containing protein-like protein n=1 Tax=Salvia divinorum TaxID=28513 RepID=A0ABD1HBT7_SALDI
MGFRDLTLRDVEEIITMKGTIFDILLATAERASDIREAEEKALQQQITQTPPFTAVVPRKRRTAFRIRTQIAQQRHQPLPEKFKNVIEEMARGKELTPATLVIQKGLCGSDVSREESRLSIPTSRISDDFLTEEERQRVGSKKNNCIDVRIVEPSGAVVTAKFCRRDVKKSGAKKVTSSCYKIKGRKWIEIVARNNLELATVVQLWCFRVDRELCFALVPLPSNPVFTAAAGDAA